jgi:hypothetical protein
MRVGFETEGVSSAVVRNGDGDVFTPLKDSANRDGRATVTRRESYPLPSVRRLIPVWFASILDKPPPFVDAMGIACLF